MNKKITVCLSAYNAEKYIKQAIDSILNQTYGNFELFIVNDKSTDKTLEIAKKYLTDNRVRVIDLKENIGTYAAKNLVLKNFASGDFWSTHDADDYSHPDKFKRELKFIEERELDGCGCGVDEFYEDGLKPRIPSQFELEYDKFTNSYRRKNLYPESVTIENISVNIDELPKLKIVKNGTLMVKMECLKKLGGFDNTRVGGDSEFMWRFVKFFKFGNLPEVHYTRRFHEDSLTQDSRVGYSSKIRKDYAKSIFAKHQQALELIKNKKHKEALKFCSYNTEHPEVSYDFYHQDLFKQEKI